MPLIRYNFRKIYGAKYGRTSKVLILHPKTLHLFHFRHDKSFSSKKDFDTFCVNYIPTSCKKSEKSNELEKDVTDERTGKAEFIGSSDGAGG